MCVFCVCRKKLPITYVHILMMMASGWLGSLVMRKFHYFSILHYIILLEGTERQVQEHTHTHRMYRPCRVCRVQCDSVKPDMAKWRATIAATTAIIIISIKPCTQQTSRESFPIVILQISFFCKTITFHL